MTEKELLQKALEWIAVQKPMIGAAQVMNVIRAKLEQPAVQAQAQTQTQPAAREAKWSERVLMFGRAISRRVQR